MTNIEEIRARADAATRGPWAWRGNMDHEDPRLVGYNRIGEDGRVKFPAHIEVLWSYPRERTADDAGAKEYRNYLLETGCAESEADERVRDEWLTDQWNEPIRDRRMCFTSPECFAVDAREAAVFEVAPEATRRDDPKVYRADIIDVRHPDAQFIAHARQDITDLLAEVDTLRQRLADEDLIRRAICDPGQFLPRGDDYAEPIPAWGARAVVAALTAESVPA